MSDQVNVGQISPTAYPHTGEGKVTTRKSWTIQEINRMPSHEYALNLQNPDFVAATDALGQPTKEETPPA